MYSIHASFDCVLTLSHVALILKVRQVNARAQAKVARAPAKVCRGLATPLRLLCISRRHLFAYDCVDETR